MNKLLLIFILTSLSLLSAKGGGNNDYSVKFYNLKDSGSEESQKKLVIIQPENSDSYPAMAIFYKPDRYKGLALFVSDQNRQESLYLPALGSEWKTVKGNLLRDNETSFFIHALAVSMKGKETGTNTTLTALSYL